MSLPYLGSKRKSAGKIYSAIKNLNPNADILVDLFCGGFAISEYFLKKGWSVIANDKNKYVIALLKKIIFDKVDEKIFTKFITREKFFDVTNKPDNYDNWYVGYVLCVWSFGNNQRNYLFGENKEPYKRAGHELVINKNIKLIQKLIPDIPQKYIDGILQQDTWYKRRIALRKVTVKLKSRILELQQLQQLQQLERLEQLQQLERLEQLQRLTIYNKCYNNISIPTPAIIYCDIPYEGGAGYQILDFNHNKFWDWVREKSKYNKIYISEYKAPSDFKLILKFSQNSTYSSGNNKNQPDECLFTFGNI